MKMKKWYELSKITVRSLICVLFHILYPHASPWLQQSSVFPVQSMFLLPEVSATSYIVQELDSDGEIDLSLVTLRHILIILLQLGLNYQQTCSSMPEQYLYTFTHISTCRSSSSSVQDRSYFVSCSLS